MKTLNITEWVRGKEYLDQTMCPMYDTNRSREYKLKTIFGSLAAPDELGKYAHAVAAAQLDPASNQMPTTDDADITRKSDAVKRGFLAADIARALTDDKTVLHIEEKISKVIQTEARGDIEVIGKPDVWQISNDTLQIIDFKFTQNPAAIGQERVLTWRKQLEAYAAMIAATGVEFSRTILVIVNIHDTGYEIIHTGDDGDLTRRRWTEFSRRITHYYTTSALSPGNRCDRCANRAKCRACLADSLRRAAESIAGWDADFITPEESREAAFFLNRTRGIADAAYDEVKETEPAYNPESPAAKKAAEEIYRRHPKEVKLTVNKETYSKYGYDMAAASTKVKSKHQKHRTLQDYSPYTD